jgi:hypothetical protein
MKLVLILKSALKMIAWLLIAAIVLGFTCFGTTLDLIGIDIISACIDRGAYIFSGIFILTGIVYAIQHHFLQKMNENNRESLIP